MVPANRIVFCTESPDSERSVQSVLGTSVEVFEAVRRYLTDPQITRLELAKEPSPPAAEAA